MGLTRVARDLNLIALLDDTHRRYFAVLDARVGVAEGQALGHWVVVRPVRLRFAFRVQGCGFGFRISGCMVSILGCGIYCSGLKVGTRDPVLGNEAPLWLARDVPLGGRTSCGLARYKP